MNNLLLYNKKNLLSEGFFLLKFNAMGENIDLFWKNFITDNTRYVNEKTPESFYFCDNEKDANDCAKLVVKKIKQATAPSLWSFEINNEKLPRKGDLNIITNWNKVPQAIILTTKIELIKFSEITEKFAQREGEGDKSLAYWKKVHKAYYKREMQGHKEEFSKDMIIVCQYFDTIYT